MKENYQSSLWQTIGKYAAIGVLAIAGCSEKTLSDKYVKLVELEHAKFYEIEKSCEELTFLQALKDFYNKYIVKRVPGSCTEGSVMSWENMKKNKGRSIYRR